MNALVFGAGNIGRGFFGALLFANCKKTNRGRPDSIGPPLRMLRDLLSPLRPIIKRADDFAVVEQPVQWLVGEISETEHKRAVARLPRPFRVSGLQPLQRHIEVLCQCVVHGFTSLQLATHKLDTV